MVNSKYVDPKFPPCEEYLQGGYLGEQGADYYGSGAQGSDFQPSGLYPRPDFGEQPFGGGGPGPGSALPARGHGQEPSGPGSHYGAPGEPCPAPQPAPLPGARACSQPTGPKQPPPGTALKQPAVVYPWMKKVHVNSGKERVQRPHSPPHPCSPLLAWAPRRGYEWVGACEASLGAAITLSINFYS